MKPPFGLKDLNVLPSDLVSQYLPPLVVVTCHSLTTLLLLVLVITRSLLTVLGRSNFTATATLFVASLDL